MDEKIPDKWLAIIRAFSCIINLLCYLKYGFFIYLMFSVLWFLNFICGIIMAIEEKQ